MEDGGAVLAEAFMQDMKLNGNGGNYEELHLYDVEDEDDLFDLF